LNVFQDETGVSINSVPVLKIDAPKYPEGFLPVKIDLQAPNRVILTIARDPRINVLADRDALLQLSRGGLEIVINDLRPAPDLSERPIYLAPSLPPEKQAPRSKATRTPPQPGTPSSKRTEHAQKRKENPPQPVKRPESKPVLMMPEITIVGQIEPPPDAPPVTEPTPPKPSDLIDSHSDMLGLNLNEEALGADLLERAKKRPPPMRT
jgi:hypothetical protein